MKNIIVVNGETDWQEYFPGYHIHSRRIQNSSWLYHQNTLWVFDTSGSLRVDAVLWRVGAIKPQPEHRSALELIRMAGIPCLNPAAILLKGYDRLSMLNELREAGLPVQTFSVALGERMLDLLHPDFPAVLKVGNFHGGFGKMRVENEGQWADARDMAFVTSEYATLEPYIDYTQDIRCLAVGDQNLGDGTSRHHVESQYPDARIPDYPRTTTARSMDTPSHKPPASRCLGTRLSRKNRWLLCIAGKQRYPWLLRFSDACEGSSCSAII